MADFSEITEKLFLGNVCSAFGCYKTMQKDVLEALEIDLVISVLSEDEYSKFMCKKDDLDGRLWIRLVVDDDENADISEYFFKVHTVISEAIKAGKNILVHCAAGVSRSPTLAIAYLMIENRWNYNKAYDFVKKKRYFIYPNAGFVKQLQNLQTILKI
jgi:dual specificity MAP kinase phosphatase